MDAVIIKAMKLRYRWMHIERDCDNVDAEMKNIYKVDSGSNVMVQKGMAGASQ